MLVLYRKYRPKSFSDILGQDIISETLKNAGRLDRLAHAYLFYGSKGSGKTTTARILAKLANCQKRQTDGAFKKTGEPCNKCQACVEIDNGRALDVIEIDAASNRGIDEIRNLKESIRVSPAALTRKVYIIDEAHQLTKDAFNALLKTLEEPPTHAILILVTTELEKMPATIVSRTQRFHFKRLPLETIIGKLKSIAKLEKINISDSAIELIAASGGGSFRDAESLLDQITSLKTQNLKLPAKGGSASGGKIQVKIETEDVESIIGNVAFKRISELAELLINGDLAGSLKFLSEINESGYNLIQFNKDLIHYLRKVLALKFSPELEEVFAREMTDQELKAIKKHGKVAEPEKIIKLMKLLIEAHTEMKYSPFIIVPFEIAIIEGLK
ncbi:DNA polymerase III subunit gamma/tau [Candidatus Wolfebacteria bacterium]|uniref:DNA polymerase III subunit gamma/tau n=1 Tax=Candidatus Wolfebacteria bacterium CG_4_10_14_0_2_um_filter_39_18 TaxID=1975061 RepID=A0A2M7TH63_9BACT|nr:DNA polymerase III subunit gamma/tau [Candidatus Wolfebacteria bacterium]NCO44773.1 DNA polymerase III subunit gamma/tau [Candidatus Wolfebacteria bacterium]PIZ45520.1 MAG: DNA polymerase III, subunit gamma and tau [Candidatus Wolfebacteria bacterium CG_4_10_14_0_2_um_filter_39_18]